MIFEKKILKFFLENWGENNLRDLYRTFKDERINLSNILRKKKNFKSSNDAYFEILFKSGFIFNNIEFSNDKDKFRDKLMSYNKNNKEILKTFKHELECPLNPQDLPPLSGYFKINFILKKPFISKDDNLFYFLENPVMKEWNFQVPMVQASSWKGNFRWMGIKLLAKKIYEKNSLSKEEKFNHRLSLIKLFGDENDADKNYLDGIFKDKKLEEDYQIFLQAKTFDSTLSYRGRLNFYPTFFDDIDYDVLTPHDRETRTPKPGPIFIEIVPEGTKGTLHFLYHPFDILYFKGRELSKEDYDEIMNDIRLIKEITSDLLCEYGFSAKKSSGYGVVDSEKLNGIFLRYGDDNSHELDFKDDHFGLKEVLFDGKS